MNFACTANVHVVVGKWDLLFFPPLYKYAYYSIKHSENAEKYRK